MCWLAGAYHVLGVITCCVGGYLPCVCRDALHVLGGIIWGALAMCWWDHLGRGAWHVLGWITFVGSPSFEARKKWPSFEVCKT